MNLDRRAVRKFNVNAFFKQAFHAARYSRVGIIDVGTIKQSDKFIARLAEQAIVFTNSLIHRFGYHLQGTVAIFVAMNFVDWAKIV